MSSKTKSYKEFTVLVLDTLKEPNKEKLFETILKETKNYTQLIDFTFKRLLDCRKVLLRVAKIRGCEFNLNVVLKKIPRGKNEFNKFFVTFVTKYQNYISKQSAKKSKKQLFTTFAKKTQNIIKLAKNDDKNETKRANSEGLNFINTKNKQITEKENKKEKRLSSLTEYLKKRKSEGKISTGLTPKKKVKISDKSLSFIEAEKSLQDLEKASISKMGQGRRRTIEGYIYESEKSRSSILPSEVDYSILNDSEDSSENEFTNKNFTCSKETNLDNLDDEKNFTLGMSEVERKLLTPIRNEKTANDKNIVKEEIESIEDLQILDQIDKTYRTDESFLESDEKSSVIVLDRDLNKDKINDNPINQINPINIEKSQINLLDIKFINEQIKFLKNECEISLRDSKGNFLNFDSKGSKLNCKSQKRSTFIIRKEIFSSRDRFIYFGDSVQIYSECAKFLLIANGNEVEIVKKDEIDESMKGISWIIEAPKNLKIHSKNVPFFTSVLIRRNIENNLYMSSEPKNGKIIISPIINEQKPQFWHISKLNLAFSSTKSERGFLTPLTLKKSDEDSKIGEFEFVQKLLHLLIGIQDDFLVANQIFKSSDLNLNALTKLKFTIDLNRTKLSTPKKRLAQKFVVFIESFQLVKSFYLERSKLMYGVVSCAFCNALKRITLKLVEFVSKMESLHQKSEISMQTLWLYIQSSSKLFKRLKSLCEIILNKETEIGTEAIKGGIFFNLLYESYLREGDETMSKLLLENIIKPTFRPYLNLLDDWMLSGKLNDTFEEFLIVQKKIEYMLDTSDQFWEQEYAVTRKFEAIPLFLQKHSTKVLKTGKFVIVMSRIGKKCNFNPELSFIKKKISFNEVVKTIDPIYKSASKRLLEVLVDEEKLISCLESFRKIFLHSRGDFIKEFLVEVENGISEHSRENSLQSFLDSKFELAKICSDSFRNEFIDRFRAIVWPHSFVSQLEAIFHKKIGANLKASNYALRKMDEINFAFDAKWPLSLFFTKSIILRYNLLFRFLFILKRTESQIHSCWTSFKPAKKFGRVLKNVFVLQKKIVHFIKCLVSYSQNFVIAIRWEKLIKDIKSEKGSFDKLKSLHDEFIATLFRFLFLSDFKVLKSILELNDSCLKFAEVVEKFWSHWDSEKIRFVNQNFSGKFNDKSFVFNKKVSSRLEEVAEEMKFNEKMKGLDEQFDKGIKRLMVLLRAKSVEHFAVFSNLIATLDFNFYFSK